MKNLFVNVLSAVSIKKAAGSLAMATLALSAAPAISQAAQINDLCYTNSAGLLYLDSSGNTVMTVQAGTLVRILDYRGPYHYLIRVNGVVGQFERSRINQASCSH